MMLSKNKDDVTITANEHTFRGNGSKTKDTECVLIYDPVSETFQLKSLDYGMRVNVSREKSRKNGGTGAATGGLQLPNSGNSAEGSSQSVSASPSPSLSLSRSPSPERARKPPGVVKNSGSSNDAIVNDSISKGSSSRSSSRKGVRASSRGPSNPAPVKSQRPQVSSKKPPSYSTSTSSKPIVPHTSQYKNDYTNNASSNDDDEDDILGALANELEESLEGENNDMSQDMDQSLVTIIDRSSTRGRMANGPGAGGGGGVGTPRNTTFTPSPSLGTRTGPISLRGYASASRADEDEMSSSEEE